MSELYLEVFKSLKKLIKAIYNPIFLWIKKKYF